MKKLFNRIKDHFYWTYNWYDNGNYYKHFIFETKNYMYDLFRVKQDGKNVEVEQWED